MSARSSLRPFLESFAGSGSSRSRSDPPGGTGTAVRENAHMGEREAAAGHPLSSVVSALFDECGTEAYSLAYRLLGGDGERAENVVEIAFLEVSRTLPNLENPDVRHLSYLTMGHVRQRCLDLLRHSAESSQQTSNERSRALPPACGAVYASLTPRQAREALASLPFELRTVVELAYFEGRSSQEIASRTGAAVHDVNRRLRLGLHHLATTLSLNAGEKTSH